MLKPTKKSNNSLNKFSINIAMIGDSKSGKSSLIECFLSQRLELISKNTVLNIYQAKFADKNQSLDLNIFEISGNYDRDKELVSDYIKQSDIILLCHSFEYDFNEENINYWLEIVEKNQTKRNLVYLVGTKYDIKVMVDYQKGITITTLAFPNGNLHSFGERIKVFINNNNIQEYFITSAKLYFNVKELFNTVIKDFVAEAIRESNKGIKDENCLIF